MYPREVSTSNSETLYSHAPSWLEMNTCLHGGGCADVRIVGTGHYADRFCWFLCVCILFPYIGPYQRLAQPDILPLLTIW